MTMMENRHNERLVTTVTSSVTSMDNLKTQYRRVLDKLAQKLQLPYGMVLEGRITNDTFNNYSLYVFFRKGDEVLPAVTPRGQVDYIDETVGGRWIRLNAEGEAYYGYESEARTLREAFTKIQEARK